MLKPGFEKKLDLLLAEYRNVTLSVMERAVNLGVLDVQMETEFVEPVVLNDTWSEEVSRTQKDLLQKYHDEHGVRCALRATVADVRRFSEGLRDGEHHRKMMESFEAAASNGADLLSVESRGGQEVFSHSLIRNDLAGIFFSVGVLAPRDVRFLWQEVTRVKGAIPAGDTACALANSAMVIANGLAGRKLSHVLSAVIRAMSSVRTLACYEEGARGPGKDCAYENVFVKAVTGYPMSMEGKTSAMAHSSLVGNVAAAACDIWSNETIVMDDVFGGKTTAVIFEMLSYDTALMNTAIRSGSRETLRQMYVDSDRYRDPQALVLCPESAFRIAKAMVAAPTDFERAVAAAREAVAVIDEEGPRLNLPAIELKYLEQLKSFLARVPDEGKLTEESVGRFRQKVPEFRPSNYGL
jgi:methanol---5-hydroxybenzimidazolylcobamide Co-methyltransferase